MRFKLICLLFIFSSCSSVRFYSEGEGNIAIAEKNFVQEEPLSFSELKEFFLWGNVPQPQEINLSSVVIDKGHFQSSNVSFEVYRTFGDILKTIFTLGMYSPVHYKVSVIGKQYEDTNYL